MTLYKPNIHIAGCVLKFELHSVRVELEVQLDPENVLASLEFVTRGIADLGAKDINHLPATPAKEPAKTGHKIICSYCGKEDYLSFKPARKGALCNDCYQDGRYPKEITK